MVELLKGLIQTKQERITQDERIIVLEMNCNMELYKRNYNTNSQASMIKNARDSEVSAFSHMFKKF